MKCLNLLLSLAAPISSSAFSTLRQRRCLITRQNQPAQLFQSSTDTQETENNLDANGFRPGSLAAATAEYGRVPYGEDSRKYRRTVYSNDDWVTHRNSDRIITNIKGMFFSGIVRQLKTEVFLVTMAALSVVLWNDLMIFPIEVLDGVSFSLPRLVLPALPFTLSSPALGLLLVFKTNASYARWSEARTTWAKIIAQSRNVVRMSSTFVPQTEEGKRSIEQLSLAVWLLCRSLMNDLSGPEDEEDYRKEIADAYLFEENSIVSKLLASPDRTMAALALASRALDGVPIDEKRRVEIDKSLVILGDCIGVCEKIYTSPVPLVCTCAISVQTISILQCLPSLY